MDNPYRGKKCEKTVGIKTQNDPELTPINVISLQQFTKIKTIRLLQELYRRRSVSAKTSIYTRQTYLADLDLTSMRGIVTKRNEHHPGDVNDLAIYLKNSSGGLDLRFQPMGRRSKPVNNGSQTSQIK